MFDLEINTRVTCPEWRKMNLTWVPKKLRNQYQNVWLLALLPPFHHILWVPFSARKGYEKQTNKSNIFATDQIVCSDTGGQITAVHWFELQDTKVSLLSRVAKNHGHERYVCVKKSPEET